MAKASWQKPREHQERLLIEVIKKNGNTEYGRRFGLQEVKSLDDLRRRHPLTTYEHYQGYVERMMDGETNILTAKTPASFVRTSGTTGPSNFGGGDPVRAAELRTEFEKGFSGLMKRVWPRLRVIHSIDHYGNLAPNRRKMGQKYVPYCVDHLPLIFASSEAFICPYLGLKSMDVHGHVPLPSVVVTEFIKVEDTDQSQPKTYFMDEVEVGQCYETALTHEWSGFYRYRMGDIFRVVGFHENCPILQFQYRTGLVLNLCYEKLNTHVVDEAIKAAVARWSGVSLTEYTVAESPLVPEDSPEYEPNEDLPYYYVFLELASSQKSLTDEEKKAVDEELRLRNGDYDRLRREGSISHPRVYSVRSGGFEALRDHILLNTNATAGQYKIPQKLRSYSFFQIMVAQSWP
ncbi:GH3 domain-containing protein-like [Diadema antillarum]|uniref:GH3 domain-containing protein-like n=1 Tax=Diadema antillarum TaxID=105358 RepID=UPI003A84EDE0